MNGPVGVSEYEQSGLGIGMVWDALDRTAGYSVVGGDDSITVTNKIGSKINLVSTGGGTLIWFLTGGGAAGGNSHTVGFQARSMLFHLIGLKY
ncbi:MAG: phosphoglycerate kinase [Oscillospiraceae bacterium]|nr:phosphoglycerate kinase [Oscillospiraceae bacterium]